MFDAIRPEGKQDPFGVEQSRTLLDKVYLWLDERIADRTWASGDTFRMADCAAASERLYADWTYAIPQQFQTSGPIARGFLSVRPTLAHWRRRAATGVFPARRA